MKNKKKGEALSNQEDGPGFEDETDNN